SLGDAIAGEGAGRMLDRYWHALRPAVAQRRLEIDKAFDGGAACCVDDIDRADDIGCGVLPPVVRVLVRRSTVDDVGRGEPGEGGIDESPVGNAAADDLELGQRGQNLRPSGREIIDD